MGSRKALPHLPTYWGYAALLRRSETTWRSSAGDELSRLVDYLVNPAINAWDGLGHNRTLAADMFQPGFFPPLATIGPSELTPVRIQQTYFE
jgi:hypothetical protein